VNRRRRSRIFQVVILIAITNIIVALVVATGLEQPFERWAAVFGSLSVIAPLWFWNNPGRQGSSPSNAEQIDHAEAKLAALVKTAWDREAGSRLLRSPQPLAVHWTPRAGSDAHGSGQNAAVRPGHMADISALVEDFRRCRRLVVLGSPESSKTTISIFILLGLLETREDSEPVPVLLSAATWDRDNEDLHSWLIRRLTREYPDLADTTEYGATAIRELVDQRRVLPVIDGLDELPARRRDRMLRALNREFPAGAWLIITCRRDEYQDAAEQSNAVTAAAVIELEPVQPGDAITFLGLSAGVRRPRWQPVLELLERDPQGDLASAFSSPLMVELARDAYGTPHADPGELTQLPNQTAIEDRLLGALISARFDDESAPGQGGRQDPASAHRWLTYLAAHLERLNSLNFGWWELRRAVPALARPGWRITVFAALAWIVTGLFFGLAAGISFGVRTGLVTGVHQGLDAALVVAMAHLLASAAGPAGSGFRVALGKLPGMTRRAATSAFDRAPRMAAALICPLPYAVETGIWYGVTNGAATGLKRATLDWIATACIVGLAVRMNVLTAGGGPTPNRFRLRRGRQLAAALIIGTLSGGIVGVIAGYSVMSDRSVMTQPRWSLDALAWIVVGLGFALVSWARTPAPAGQAATPVSTLTGDRALVLWGLPAIILFALVYGFAFTLAPGRGLQDFLHFGTYGIGLGLALWFVVASTQAWPQYQAAAWGLAVRGRLPWRLMAFLEDAHRLRILRQDGSAYQFKHARLQKYLTQNSAATSSSAAQGPPTTVPP
jgi:hypothetical protein